MQSRDTAAGRARICATDKTREQERDGPEGSTPQHDTTPLHIFQEERNQQNQMEHGLGEGGI